MRNKNNGKRAVSIVLSEDIIKKLDFVCENTDRRKNEVVTRLIREEYDKIKKGGH
jgi:predicted transcriptional regulator